MRPWLGTPDTRLESLYGLWLHLPRSVQRTVVDGYARLAQRHARGPAGPQRLVLFVTNRCTRRCGYCFYLDRLNDPKVSELSSDEVRELARKLPRRLATATLTGGEPFLRNDLEELVWAFVDGNRSRAVTINTNGDLPEQAEAAVAGIVGRPGVRLQLHVSIQNEGDLTGAPGRTLDAFLRLARTTSRITRVATQTTIVRENAAAIPDLLRTIRARGARAKLQHIRGVPGTVFPVRTGCLAEMPAALGENQALSVSEQEVVNAAVYRLLAEADHPLFARAEWLHLKLATRIQQAGRPLYECGAGTVDAVVFENGDVSVCEPLRPTASLRDYAMDFKALWNDTPFRRARAAVRGCACTHPCNIATASVLDRELLHEMLG